MIITSRKADACTRAVAQLNALPGLAPGARAVAAPANSATAEGVASLVAQVRALTPRVDVLLANAGASWGEAFDTHPDAAVARVLDLNVRAVFNTVRELAPLLLAGRAPDPATGVVEDPARVIVTASTTGLGVGTLGRFAAFGYSASKAAVIHLARNLAVDLGPRGVTVNSICPGWFPTRMTSDFLEGSGGLAHHARSNPLRRLGRPEDFAGAVVYLSSRAGAYVNGAALELDGGGMWVAGGVLQSGMEDLAGDVKGKAKL